MARRNQNLTAKKVQQPPSKPALSHKMILEAIAGSRGILAVVARRCGVSRTTVYNALKESPELQAALAEARETLNDDVEMTIADDMLGGWIENPDKPGEKFYRYPNAVLLMFWAKTQMKNRGFVEKLDIGLSPDVTAILPQLQAAAKEAGLSLAEVLAELTAEIGRVKENGNE